MTPNRGPRTAADRRELRLWRVGWALTAIFTAAILAAGSIFYSLIALLDFQEIDTTAKLDAKTLFDIVKLSFGVVAGAGALVALVVAYRRQRVDEAGAHREATRLHTERFSQAVDKLGSDSPAVRLGGVHSLAGLADDAPEDSLRQTCIDVLCAYLRLPFSPAPGDLPDPLPDGTSPSEERRDAHQDKKDRHHAFREVRHTILRLIGDHYRIPEGTRRSWQGCNLDLTRVTIDGNMDFTGAAFSAGSVDFTGATVSGSTLSFNGATFCGSVLSFRDSTLSESTLSFRDATFSGGEVSFRGATLSDSMLSVACTTFSGGKVLFADLAFSGRQMSFDLAEFSGGTVEFGGAMVSGGDVHFGGAMFSGSEVNFNSVVFSAGRVGFTGATFSGGEVYFSGFATFSGATVSFADTTFSGGKVSFSGARFAGSQVSFVDATFSGSEVSFDHASGPAPAGLLAAASTSVPPTVTLPSTWLPVP
ncbi:pentapeptide repeat-containing protein [Streptomyces sp. NPDC005790]|uniref:pentapeptide repeat-containing protein n=1 Tax=Streptomyces sp. NPDC005790 TaxID=3154777 RepID=UPI0033E535F7